MSSQTTQFRGSRRPIDEYAKLVADAHLEGKPEDTQLYMSWGDGEVRLIEVASQYPDSDEVLPFHFSAQPERNFDYPVVIVLHSSNTWDEHDDKSTLLPDGWDFEQFRLVEDAEAADC